MMYYANLETGESGLSILQLRARFPDFSLPDDLAEFEGWRRCRVLPVPDFDPEMYQAQAQTPGWLGDELVQGWDVVPLSPEQVEAIRRAKVPQEVPRWAGRLALKRHVLEASELVLLEPADSRPDNLLAGVLAWRASLPDGELADRVDAALDDAKDWLRDSETVGAVAAVLGLDEVQVDSLFLWAAVQRA